MRSSRSQLVLAVCLAGLLGATTTARAENDGGARSVFAYGAGNRALSLGGAYGALANDASAPLWNAAGLGRVDRTQLLFTQASYYGIGMNEQFASIALPHWKWGVGSVTFRRFAVDGIERRDDRNVLVDSDLSDSETELLLGYGRNFGTAWSAGAALKVRRQSLAGLTDSGVGLDVGVMAMPLELLTPNGRYRDRVTLGLAIRNLVQPGLRLMQENVADPTGVRFGAAFHAPIFDRLFRVAMDVEKTSRMDARLHTGVEFNVHPLLAVRAGISDGQLTTGMGIEYSGVTVDYAFEQNDIENVHRIGAALSFGPTVGQSRKAAVDARERELQQRFDQAFRERQSSRIAELLDEASAAESEGRYEDALKTLAVVVALDPNHTAANRGRTDCWIALGRQADARGDLSSAIVNYSQALSISPNDPEVQEMLEQAREKSDRLAARSADIRARFTAAMDAFSDQDLSSARDGFTAILEVAPDDAEAAEMLARTSRAIDRRVRDLVVRAGQLIEWGQLVDAAAAIEEAKALDPEAAGVGRVATRLADEQRAHRNDGSAPDVQSGDTTDTTSTGGVVPSRTRELTDEEIREAERLYRRAIIAISNKRSDEAIRYLELVWSIDPEYQSVSEHLKREYITRGMEYFADGAFEKAVEMWENALRIDPNDQRAKGYLSRAREQATRTREILGGSR